MVTLPGSMLGAEGTVLRRQLARFMVEHPEIRVVQRATPDAADQRHQLYVQWLNARASEPDILQLDAIWTPEFAAAGWILDLDRFGPATGEFFPATVTANSWRGRLYALPWFVDVGMLYWRTDLMKAPPATFDELERIAARARRERGLRYGLVWQGARYEGLVTVFAEYLGGHGGTILDGRAGDGGCARGDRGAHDHARRDLPRQHRPAGRADLARGGVPLRLPERRGGIHAQLALSLCSDAGQRELAGRGPVSTWRRCRRPRAAARPPPSAARSSPSMPTAPIPRRPGR